jgi:hypothetical protein
VTAPISGAKMKSDAILEVASLWVSSNVEATSSVDFSPIWFAMNKMRALIIRSGQTGWIANISWKSLLVLKSGSHFPFCGVPISHQFCLRFVRNVISCRSDLKAFKTCKTGYCSPTNRRQSCISGDATCRGQMRQWAQPIERLQKSKSYDYRGPEIW